MRKDEKPVVKQLLKLLAECGDIIENDSYYRERDKDLLKRLDSLLKQGRELVR